MGLEDTIKRAVDNIKDAVNEAQHRRAAEAEQTNRDAVGDAMPTEEKIGSVVNQKVNEAQAAVDRAKQDARNNT